MYSKITLSIRIQTPLIIGDYNAKPGEQLKLSSLRGAMKDFFRSLIAPHIDEGTGGKDAFLKTLFGLDHFIFGHTSEEFPPVFKGLLQKKNGCTTTPPFNMVNHREHKEYESKIRKPPFIRTKAIKEESQYTLTLFPRSDSMKKRLFFVTSMLLGTSVFAGVGRAKKRGYGSFFVEPIKIDKTEMNCSIFNAYKEIFKQACPKTILEKVHEFYKELKTCTIRCLKEQFPQGEKFPDLAFRDEPSRKMYFGEPGRGHLFYFYLTDKEDPFFVTKGFKSFQDLNSNLMLGIHDDSGNKLYGNFRGHHVSGFYFTAHKINSQYYGIFTFRPDKTGTDNTFKRFKEKVFEKYLQ